MPEKPKAVVLLSGGMDSCVTAAIAHQSHRLALLHASYGQRTEQRERRAFEEIADFYGAEERLVVRLDSFRQIGGSALTDPRIAVPESGTALAAGAGIPVTYVPFRNAHFLSAAVSWAEAIGAMAVFIGAVAEDSSGDPDCRPEYYRAFAQLVRDRMGQLAKAHSLQRTRLFFYGPLALGTTTVIYEGVPNYPDGGRPWRIAEKLGVNIFHTSPTAIRMLRKVGPEEPK